MAKKTATKTSVKQNGANVKTPKGKAKPVAKPETEESEESEEEMPVIPEPAKRKAKVTKKAAAPPAKKSKKAKVPEPEPESSEEEESDDAELSGEEMDDEEASEEEVAKPVAKKAAAKAKNGKPAPAAEEDSDDDEEESEEESEEEAPAPVKKSKKAAAPAKKAAKEESEGDASSEDEMVIKSAKSGAGLLKPQAPGEEVSIFVGNLPDDDGEREEKIRKFFGDVALNEVRSNSTKNFAHVTLVNAGDRDKALELNGGEIDGSILKLDQARGKNIKPAGEAAPAGNRVAMFGCQLASDVIQEATGANDVFCLDAKKIAFLTFNSNDEAAELVKNGPVLINGREYNVEMARPKADRGNDRGGFRGGRGGGFGGRGGGGFGGRDGGGRGGRGGRGGFRGGRGGQGGASTGGCRNCGKDGHFARECPKPVTCRKCQGEGHISSNCSA